MKNQMELAPVENKVEASMIDVSTTGFFLTTLSLANETKEVTYGAED